MEWDKCWVGGGWLAIVSKLKVPQVASSSTQSQSLVFFFYCQQLISDFPHLSPLSLLSFELAYCSVQTVPGWCFYHPQLPASVANVSTAVLGCWHMWWNNFHCVQNKWTGAVWHPGWHIWPHTHVPKTYNTACNGTSCSSSSKWGWSVFPPKLTS